MMLDDDDGDADAAAAAAFVTAFAEVNWLKGLWGESPSDFCLPSTPNRRRVLAG